MKEAIELALDEPGKLIYLDDGKFGIERMMTSQSVTLWRLTQELRRHEYRRNVLIPEIHGNEWVEGIAKIFDAEIRI